MIVMPRSVDELLQHADDLTDRFEDHDPSDADERDADAVRQLRSAFQ